MAASIAEGRLRLDMPKPQTIADGLQGRMGDLTWPVVRDLVDAVVTACPVQHTHESLLRLTWLKFMESCLLYEGLAR